MASTTQGLKQRTYHAGKWVLAGYAFSQITRFGGNLVLTRLLIPEMFGVMAIVNLLLAGLTMFSDVGLLQNIVQSDRGEDSDYLNTAWTIQILRGFLIFIIALLISVALYYFNQYGLIPSNTTYSYAQLPVIMASMSVIAVIAGFNSIHLLLLNRKLMMIKLVFIEVFSQCSGLAIMLFLAWKNHDIWALVTGTIATSFITLFLSHTTKTGPRCRFFWDTNAVREIIHFGKWIFISSILGFLLNQGDRLVLGWLIGPEQLGVYTVAFFLATAGKDLLMKLVGSVFFPVLSEVGRNDPSNLKQIYYKLRYKIDIASMFIAGLLYAIGSDIINILYDDRYTEAGWMIQILSLVLVSVGYMLSSQCFLAVGRPKLETTQIIVQLLSLYILMFLGYWFIGLEGAIWGITLASIVRVFFSLILMKKYLFINVKLEFIGVPFIFIGWLVGETGRAVLFQQGRVYKFSQIYIYKIEEFWLETIYPFLTTLQGNSY